MSVVGKLKIGTRLGLAFGLLVVLMMLMAAISRGGLDNIDHRLGEVLDDRYVKVRAVSRIFDELNLQARNARNVLLMDKADERSAELSSIRDSRQRAGEIYEKLIPSIRDPKAKELLGQALETRKTYGASLDAFMAQVAGQNMDAARIELLNRLRPAQLAYVAELRKLVEQQEQLMADSGVKANAAVEQTSMLLLGAVAIGAVAGLIFGVLATRSVTRPLAKVRQAMEAVAAGDLSRDVPVDRGDELGDLQQSLSRMVTGLRGLVQEVRTGVDSVTTASTQIAMGNLDLSSRTEEQASSLEETASAMEELTGTVRQAADGAREATALAQSASVTAADGGEAVGRVVATMNAITDSSRRIEDIIGVIDSIAFQTNILALNAAVEAARAGENGRGFAVVASEVRSLAQRSAGAAREIKSLISTSTISVETGGREVAAAGETMRKIVDQIQQVSALVSEISGAAQEQSRGIEQINQAVAQMDQVTQQNAALVEESAAAAGSLEHQAKRLSEAISSFKLV
ncbi:methyl-accepting chemotaxis protein [Roseateles sp. YR242]|uniref:methyl-accepting chemotaxis protein n=1 Tax=Roseateles sp. YR242 TaxID=1855305 RepID=UPI0008B772A9|nr:methyl-accepting chemotaxis protein [Roseateles sp. YR242]SEL23338.1 methyl-accepting chemotaxis protein [Roseateles sp. YR242]